MVSSAGRCLACVAFCPGDVSHDVLGPGDVSHGVQLGLFVGPTHWWRLPWPSYLTGHRRSSGLGQAVANRRVGVGGEITTAQDDDIKVVHSS